MKWSGATPTTVTELWKIKDTIGATVKKYEYERIKLIMSTLLLRKCKLPQIPPTVSSNQESFFQYPKKQPPPITKKPPSPTSNLNFYHSSQNCTFPKMINTNIKNIEITPYILKTYTRSYFQNDNWIYINSYPYTVPYINNKIHTNNASM